MRCIFRKTGRFTTMAENHILTFDNGYGSMMDIQYFNGLEEYNGTILLVGINYDKDKKQHQYRIEEMVW